ncbi:DUF2231 domain-containing protein [Desulfomonile tiedjei]|uniref:Putative heme/steroid binding protein n=1 Tax=Desulfomonile tiedjei (strain ATCC 49306 / DSM 6799 / DCB-1) TaxID=706587 RepID=I4CBZ3_DESTA|nr:DUF2231 domain-containing protein [Desulfomonile tiedjei]AFM27084.1 putative heme/steroid binding protein [Desulfomonile tiedjei DSM 6799]
MDRQFDREGLAKNDGRENRPAFVAVNGTVYDVSASKRWAGGNHMKRHQAGTDLSMDIISAPHGLDVLDRFQSIGVYTPTLQAPSSPLKARVEDLLDTYPFFRRHPHPAVVHVPVGFLTIAPFLVVLSIVFGSARTEWAAYCCVLVATVSIPPSIATGYFTWWINYDLHDSPIIASKRRLAWVTLILAVLAGVTRGMAVQEPVNFTSVPVLIYLLLVSILAVLAARIGFLGGKLVFPYDSH